MDIHGCACDLELVVQVLQHDNKVAQSDVRDTYVRACAESEDFYNQLVNIISPAQHAYGEPRPTVVVCTTVHICMATWCMAMQHVANKHFQKCFCL